MVRLHEIACSYLFSIFQPVIFNFQKQYPCYVRRLKIVTYRQVKDCVISCRYHRFSKQKIAHEPVDAKNHPTLSSHPT